MYTLKEQEDIATVKTLLTRHSDYTGSPLVKRLLLNFDDNISSFKKILPNDYRRITEALKAFEARGEDPQRAAMLAFEEVQK